MTTKQILFTIVTVISVNSFITAKVSQQKDFVFDRGMFTQIKGNMVSSFIYVGFQPNPSYVFEHTRVVECSKDKKLKEIGTLGSLQKVYKSRLDIFGNASSVDRFEEFASMNNAIYCYNIEQKLNYYDELEDVGAILYGTRNVEDCSLVREFVALQKLAAEKNA